MLAGILEIQLMADIARLSTDMRRAEEQVKNSTDKMGRSVATLESAFGKLGSTLALGAVFEGVRRLSDDYVKLTAQIRIATHSQAEYANGLAEVRRISTESQASITATGALYTRLTNSLGAYGATQKQVANITETVSLGLKAYGATSVEASSAMLQLSQAFASNRLGGDEFRAMMESMPNMMRTLATSMGVPFEALKVLSAEGKITAKEMMKAWDDPALIASLQNQANMTRTITGEITVLRNNLMMLVGELMGATKGTQGITAVLHAMSDSVLMLAKHIEQLAAYATIMAALFAGKWLKMITDNKLMMISWTEASAMQAASVTARAAKIAEIKQLEIYMEREAVVAAQAATKAVLVQTQAIDVAYAAQMRLTMAVHDVNIAHAEAIVMEKERAAALLRLATAANAVNAAEVEAIAVERALAIERAAATAAAEARAAAEIGALAKVANFAKGLVGGTLGIIGLALWGAYEIADHLGWIDKVFNRAKSNMDALKGLAGDSPIFAKAFKYMEDEMAKYEANIKRVAAMKELGVTVSVNATPTELIAAIDKALKDLDHAIIWGQTNRLEAAMQLKLLRKGLEEPIVPVIAVAAKQIDHDLLFVTKRYDELLAKFEKGDIVQWQLTEGIKKMYEELSPKAEKASSEVNSWNKRLAEQAAALAGVAEEGRKLTKSETEYNDLVVALNITKDKQLKNAGEELMLKAQLNVASEAALVFAAEEQKAIEKKAEVMRQINAHGISQIDTLDKEIAAQKLHNDSIGRSAEQIANLKTEAEALLIVKMEDEARDLSSAATSDAVAATKLVNIQAEIAKMKELRNLKAGAAPLEAAKKLADEERKANEKLWHDIDGFAHTAFDNIFDKGKNVFEEMGKVIKKSILDMLYQMTIKKWIFSIGTTSAGVGASGLAGAADLAGGGGSGSWLSAGSSVYNAISGGFTSLGTTLSSSVASTGQWIAANVSQSVGQSISGWAQAGTVGAAGPQVGTLATAGSYVGAGLAGIGLGSTIAGNKTVIGLDGTTASAIGAGLGLFITGGNPVGAFIGGIAGGVFDAAFGSGPKVSGTTTLAGSFSQKGFAGQYQTPWSQEGGWFSSGSSGVDISPVAQAQSDALKNIVVGAKSVFDNLIAASGEANKSLTGWTFAINRQVATQERQTQLATDLATSMGDFLIPSLKQLMATGESLADTAVRLHDEFVLTNTIANLMGKSFATAFGATGLASMGARDNIVSLLGGVQSANTKMQSFYQTFFSDAERRNIQLMDLSRTLTQLGVTNIPQTNSQFRSLMQAQDLTTTAGRGMFAALLDLAPAFDQVTKLTDSLNGGLQSLSTNYFASKLEYDRFIGRIKGGSVAAPASNDELVVELKAMRAELTSLRTSSEATAASSRKTTDLLRNVTRDGNSLITTPA